MTNSTFLFDLRQRLNVPGESAEGLITQRRDSIHDVNKYLVEWLDAGDALTTYRVFSERELVEANAPPAAVVTAVDQYAGAERPANPELGFAAPPRPTPSRLAGKIASKRTAKRRK